MPSIEPGRSMSSTATSGRSDGAWASALSVSPKVPHTVKPCCWVNDTASRSRKRASSSTRISRSGRSVGDAMLEDFENGALALLRGGDFHQSTNGPRGSALLANDLAHIGAGDRELNHRL